MWVMTIGGSVCILWSAFAIKPISMLYEKAEKINIKLVLAVGSGCLVGVMAYVSVSYGFSAMSTKGVVFCISFAVGAFLMLVANKVEKAKWLTDYIMTISMLAAMRQPVLFLGGLKNEKQLSKGSISSEFRQASFFLRQ